MTARYYNFTKQNGGLQKAKKRFTKQNGVVKEIVAGWTKQNGVVEQVYTTSRIPTFHQFIPLLPSNSSDPVFVTDTYNAMFNGSETYVQSEYWNEGQVQQISFSGYSFNYAGGVENQQSILNVGTYPKEMLLSDPSTILGQTLWGYSDIHPYIRLSTNNYVALYQGYGTTDLAYVSSTTRSRVTVTNVPKPARSYSSSITLQNGKGVWYEQTENGDYGIYDYDDSASPNKLTYTTLFTPDSDESFYSWHPNIYTTNGTNCIMSIVSSVGSGIPTYYTRLCKYDTQTKTYGVSKVSGVKHILGTYNGYIYTAENPGLHGTGVLSIRKYDTDFNLIATHVVPRDSLDISEPHVLEFSGAETSMNSGGKYVGVKWATLTSPTKYYYLIIDLSLF